MPGYVLGGPSDTGRWTRIIILGPRLTLEFSGPWHMAAYVISMATVFSSPLFIKPGQWGAIADIQGWAVGAFQTMCIT
jgi:hypothetical protein